MNNKSLSWSSARNICIVKTLAKLGHYPTRKSEKEAWFLSPLRSETQASFSVSLKKNLWFDYGLGQGGNIIDLIMVLKTYSFREAMNFLAHDVSHFLFCPNTIPNKKILNKDMRITRIDFISHPALKKYVESRGITYHVARDYCREVWYRLNAKEYFTIGLENHLGGWELRNSYFKGSSSPKSYTYIKRKSKTVLITEGMFDFLSLIILEEDLVKASDIIILNSLAFTNKITGHLTNYENIRLYLDNDPAGDQATVKILKLFRSATDERNYLKNYKDLNEKLMQCKK